MCGDKQTELKPTTLRKSGKKPCGTKCCCCCKNWCHECGLPKCKVLRPTNWAPGTLNTEYLAEFIKKKGLGNDNDKSVLPGKQYVASKATFDGLTTNQRDFKPIDVRREKLDKQGAAPFPERPFDGQTTYNTFHDGKRGLFDGRKKKPYDTWSAPFIGTTSNRADYVQWDAAAPQGMAPQYKLLTVPFEGTSTYKVDFNKKPMPDADRRAPPPLLPSHNLLNYTTYAVDYNQHAVVPNSKVCCDDWSHPADCPPGARHHCKQRPGSACSSCGPGRPSSVPAGRGRVPCAQRPWTTCSSCAGSGCGGSQAGAGRAARQ
mmetsp:Transcript_10756/g.23131  ORF Transcript_10756/g.23131 Transcript_10756/m.23131 type:complete len:317 (+) Transcript_10756:106-1056(+)